MRRKVFGSGWRRKRESAERTSSQRHLMQEGMHDGVQQQQKREPGFRPLHILLHY